MTESKTYDLLSQFEIEGKIQALSDRLEELITDMPRVNRAAAEAEYEYKRELYKARFKADGRNAEEREANAELALTDVLVEGQAARVCDLAFMRKVAEGIQESHVEACRGARAQLSAFQTLSANVRAIS